MLLLFKKMQESNYDYLFKFALAGEEKVGKTEYSEGLPKENMMKITL